MYAIRSYYGFRVLTLLDHFSRVSPAVEVGSSITGKRVVEVLERVARTHGLPQVITMDNGTEFTCRVVDEWAHRNGVKLDFIRPGVITSYSIHYTKLYDKDPEISSRVNRNPGEAASSFMRKEVPPDGSYNFV